MKDVCFQCDHTKCPEVDIFYDLNGDLNKNLLVPGPFQKCTYTPYPPSGRCTMCSLDYYYALCRNVSESIQPALEAKSTAITNYEQTNCSVIGFAPTTVNSSDLTGAGGQNGHPGGELWWLLIIIPVLLSLFLIGIVYWHTKKRNRNRNHVV